MQRPLLFTLIIVALLFSFELSDQELQLDTFLQKHTQLNQSGMKILVAWSILNIGTGSYYSFNTTGNTKYLHQMNAGWNLVNLGLGIGGLIGLSNGFSTDITYLEALKEGQQMEKILLFNTALDIGYMATGAWLWERGLRKSNNRLTGYGQSLVIQGGFLFVFDAALAYLNNNLNSNFLENLSDFQLISEGTSMGLRYSL